MEEKQKEYRCIVCGKCTEDGIHICKQWICVDCESEIVKTDVEDEKYPFFIHQLRRLWYEVDA